MDVARVNEGAFAINNVITSRSCEASGLTILGSSMVFPDGVDSTILVDGKTSDDSLVDHLENWGNSIQMLMSRSAFTHGNEKIDTNGNIVGIWVGGRFAEPPALSSLIPLRFKPVQFNPSSCAQRVVIKVPTVEICELTSPDGFVQGNTVNLWTESGLGTVYDSPENGEGSVSYAINRTSALPENCDAGVIVEVHPSAEQINRDMPIEIDGQQVWPEE